MLFIAFPKNQFQKFWDRCNKTFEFQQTTIPPPPVQCCVPFLVGFDVFWFNETTLIGVGGGVGGGGEWSGIVCKKL
jgi:hypothetical protein